ncbi:hypothetical protein EVG20_g2968 [Dentipellis fragilis]|uniref:Uncharacterized protein n=1 Tax=Dentipellis fragilis TaxID=205917 RepID=A0A4Y9Z580_9AGAM|nr:hypothetical protein EVG20_g2968 [Dentipellis fragilis]
MLGLEADLYREHDLRIVLLPQSHIDHKTTRVAGKRQEFLDREEEEEEEEISALALIMRVGGFGNRRAWAYPRLHLPPPSSATNPFTIENFKNMEAGDPSPLERLNDDTLILLVNWITFGYRRDIVTLSMTSKRLRALCLPILFQRAKVKCRALCDSGPPPASWPYIRTMDISGFFETGRGFSEGNLEYILPHLVALRKIRFLNLKYGVSWYELQFMLFAPNLRVLEIEEPRSFQREDFSFPDDTCSVSLPFTEFIYTIGRPPDFDWFSHWGSADVARHCYMNPLFFSLHQQLEVLHLPASMAPLPEMSSMKWPRLRELRLYGEDFYGEDSSVFMRLFSTMPRLRILDLHILHKGPLTRTLVWPFNVSFKASFDNIDRFSLPYPDPSDTVYVQLPSTLRQLHLLDRPRYYRFSASWMVSSAGYTKPILTSATELLHIFKQMCGPFVFLERLEVAYKADAQDTALIHYITTTFPNLRFLQVHRYRSEGETIDDIEATVGSISQNISTLHSLRHFRVYLNFPVDDYRPPRDPGQQYAIPVMTTREFTALLRRCATAFSMNCSPTLQTIDLLSTWIFGSQIWKRWTIRRNDNHIPRSSPTRILHGLRLLRMRFRDGVYTACVH